MDKKKETGMAVIATVIMLIIIAVGMLCSCTTKEIVTKETVTVHDTLWSHSTDTVRDVKVYTIHDTLRYAETHTITLNNQGDTIREIHHFPTPSARYTISTKGRTSLWWIPPTATRQWWTR